MKAKQPICSVLMLPWLAHGHVSSFLELAKRLAKKNFLIYLCSTPINLKSIENKITQEFSHSIQLVELQLPALPNLPPHYHTTNGLPPHLMLTLKEAFELSSENFSFILKELQPNFVLFDFLQPWAATAASSLKIPAAQFFTTGGVTSCFMIHFSRKGSLRFPFSSIYLHDFEEKKISQILNSSSANGVRDADKVFEGVQKSTSIVLVKSFKEIEGKYLDHLSILAGKKAIPVGPLVRDFIDDGDDEGKASIMEWLDKKEQSSVVYVSFGSEYFSSMEELQEIAYGLELSGVSFIWVVRFPTGENIKLEEALPKGLPERVGERGLVLEGWAPQTKILRHTSVGGFLSHCGWNSVMETMKIGVPIIAMPMHLDQPFNARLVQDVGIALEVKRDINGRLERDEIAKVIREVMVEEKGEELRKKSKELSQTMLKKEDEEIDLVVEELLQLCKIGKTN
ncbi:UDP-glucuronosyl/UDP-glucosyltransferase [Dillenia turbinata]|uniref:Glycosyltransferase n=1 Tax=Dillenia turbinata TaxID=194707 RepID=A0AAN8VPP1_9MAGN